MLSFLPNRTCLSYFFLDLVRGTSHPCGLQKTISTTRVQRSNRCVWSALLHPGRCFSAFLRGEAFQTFAFCGQVFLSRFVIPLACFAEVSSSSRPLVFFFHLCLIIAEKNTSFWSSVQHQFFTAMSSEFTFGNNSDEFTTFRFFLNLADRDLTEYQITQTLTLS